MINGLNVD